MPFRGLKQAIRLGFPLGEKNRWRASYTRQHWNGVTRAFKPEVARVSEVEGVWPEIRNKEPAIYKLVIALPD